MAHLKILSWNIWMMPGLTFQSPSNAARATSIGRELIKLDFDILCFIKAFDAPARAVLREELGKRYPHRYGPLNKGGSIFEINGGVYVMSKVPLTVVREIRYRDTKGIESHSKKGAMLLKGMKDDKPFQLIGTHLQGEPGAGDENQGVRNKQIAQLAAELVDTTSDPAVPLFICGDFNTPRRVEPEPAPETKAYLDMIKRLGVRNGPGARVTLDDRRDHNDLALYDKGRQAELDYILLRDAGQPIEGKWEAVHLTHRGWDGAKGRRDLAYRYGVCGQFTW